MGLRDFETARVRLVPSDLESERFGFRTDRLTVGLAPGDSTGLASDVVRTVERELSGSTALVTILRYPSRLAELPGSLDLDGIRIIPAGTLLYWQAPASVEPKFDGPPGSAFAAVELDETGRRSNLDGVLGVVRTSFTGYRNHYSANPLIGADAIVDGYAQWAEATIARPESRVFAVMDEETPVAVAVTATQGDDWEVELASVHPDYQGRGLYLTLMSAVVRGSIEARAARLVISTQSYNIGVQRAWAKLGFRPIMSVDTVHLLRQDPAS